MDRARCFRGSRSRVGHRARQIERLQPPRSHGGLFVALALSMTGLAYAMRAIPVGTAHAVWVGIGAALTVALAMGTGAESASPAKLVFLVGTVVSVVGLKLTR